MSRVVGPHVFVDETRQRGYLLAAAVVEAGSLAASRQAIRALIMPRQRRIHFKGESNPRRHKILDAIIDLGVRANIYQADRRQSDADARRSCLIRLVADVAELKAARLVLEPDDSAVKADQAVLYANVRATGLADSLRYEHLRAHEECLLALPDAIAWCWARGGHWRSRVQEIVVGSRHV
jgi:hypothetical protein